MSPSVNDRVAGAALGIAAWLCGGISLLILIWVGVEAIPALNNDPGISSLLGDAHWLPGSVREPQFGMLPILAGSVLVTIFSIIPATVAGVGCAVFQRFYAPKWMRTFLRRVLELLAGIPSVVIGFWGLVVLVPILQKWQPPGQSLAAAAIVLAIMILPTVALTASTALKNVSPGLFRAAAALGMGRARTILGVALPTARRGIAGGVILAAARAIGETMAVVMVCGNVAQWPGSIFDPIRPATATIALEMSYATAGHRSVLFALAFFLVLVVGAAVGWIAFRKPSTPHRR
ncbi:MAG: phosphate ABC transporter permease subunit PstC [Verrucomicrobiales bacterium]|nr:phosphate ABC transporter permease subunit PstC [Verrucomicrobiales bacterium]